MVEGKKEVLRPQWDSRKQLWKIVKKTWNGSHGWGRFQELYYLGKSDAEKRIDEIVSNQPEMYEKEA